MQSPRCIANVYWDGPLLLWKQKFYSTWIALEAANRAVLKTWIKMDWSCCLEIDLCSLIPSYGVSFKILISLTFALKK